MIQLLPRRPRSSHPGPTVAALKDLRNLARENAPAPALAHHSILHKPPTHLLKPRSDGRPRPAVHRSLRRRSGSDESTRPYASSLLRVLAAQLSVRRPLPDPVSDETRL